MKKDYQFDEVLAETLSSSSIAIKWRKLLGDNPEAGFQEVILAVAAEKNLSFEDVVYVNSRTMAERALRSLMKGGTSCVDETIIRQMEFPFAKDVTVILPRQVPDENGVPVDVFSGKRSLGDIIESMVTAELAAVQNKEAAEVAAEKWSGLEKARGQTRKALQEIGAKLGEAGYDVSTIYPFRQRDGREVWVMKKEDGRVVEVAFCDGEKKKAA